MNNAMKNKFAANRCFQKKPKQKKEFKTKASRKYENDIKCHNCGGVRHIQRVCPSSSKKKLTRQSYGAWCSSSLVQKKLRPRRHKPGIRIDEGPVHPDSTSSSLSSNGLSSSPSSPSRQSSPQKITEFVHTPPRRVKKVVSRPSKIRVNPTQASKATTEIPLKFLSSEEDIDFLRPAVGTTAGGAMVAGRRHRHSTRLATRSHNPQAVQSSYTKFYQNFGSTSSDPPPPSNMPADVNFEDYLVDPEANVVGAGPCSRQTGGHDNVETAIPGESA
ncbi:hypothetical protein ACLOJK_006947 [Asimina triloba]